MKSYLIVGGSSDIAKITAKKLLEAQAAVTCLVRDTSRVEDLQTLGATIVAVENPEAISFIAKTDEIIEDEI